MPIMLTVLSEYVAIRRASFPAIPPFTPLSTRDEFVLCLCSETQYVMSVLHCLYLRPSIVTVALSGGVLPFPSRTADVGVGQYFAYICR